MPEMLRDLISRIVDRKEQMPDQSLSLMGNIAPNPRSLKMYAMSAPYLADRLDDPKKLMEYIDKASQRESSRSAGNAYSGYDIKAAQDALTNLYGINDYTPKGFMKIDPATGKWVDARPFADTTKNPQWIPSGEMNEGNN